MPSFEEYQNLINELGGEDIAATKMCSFSYWDKHDGTNESGFNLLPGGFRGVNDNNFHGKDSLILLWTGNKDVVNNLPVLFMFFGEENSNKIKITQVLDFNNDFGTYTMYPIEGYIRCIKD